MARGQASQQTVTVGESLPRPQIVLALGLSLIVVNMLTSGYWQSVIGAVFGPKPAASATSSGAPPPAQHAVLGG